MINRTARGLLFDVHSPSYWQLQGLDRGTCAIVFLGPSARWQLAIEDASGRAFHALRSRDHGIQLIAAAVQGAR